MGVVFSNGPISFTTLRQDTSAHILADIDTQVTGCGWTGTAITGGTKYLLTSPQGVQAKCKVFDDGGTVFGGWHYITIQFMSTNETSIGFAHKLLYNVPAQVSAGGYQIVCNGCQLFISTKTITTQQLVTGSRNYCFAGGIPYVGGTHIIPSGGPPIDPTGDCATSGGNSVGITDIWWTCGNVNGDGNFRNSRYCTNNYSVCKNGSVFTQTSFSNAYTGSLQLYPLTYSEDVDAGYRVPYRSLKYGVGEPLNIDPFIGWGFQIQGQLWDAFLKTRDETVDSIITTVEALSGSTRTASWIAWNYDLAGDLKGGSGTYFETLYLLTGPPSNPSTASPFNYAY